MSSTNGPEAARPPRPWSLAARLTAWYSISAFLLIAVATGFLYWVLVVNLVRQGDEFLADKVHILQTLLRDRPDDVHMLREEVELEPAARQYGQVYVRILDADGTTQMETSGMSAVLPAAAFPAAGDPATEPAPVLSVTTPTGTSFRAIVASGHRGTAGGTPVVIQVALDRSRELELLARYRQYLWPALGVALIVCALAGYQIARRGLRPLSEITAAARRIRSTTLHERIAAAGLPAELDVLAARFNEMLDRLQEAFDRLARFSADIAHELRTPVNNLRGEAEVALGRPRSPEEYQEVLGSCLEETSRLSRLIDNLLFVARAESPQMQIAREALDIGRELATLREYYEAAASEAGVALVVEAEPTLVADLDRTLFQRAVGNLVANALAHTPAGGTITLRAFQDEHTLTVEVADTGAGIAPEHLPHIFDRFYRADPARSTAAGRVGLGLAIVKAIAALHRGSAAVASEVGKGTRMRLTFPRVGPSARYDEEGKSNEPSARRGS
jgi:two-component system heavy metal sensor histidine kinase CusS